MGWNDQAEKNTEEKEINNDIEVKDKPIVFTTLDEAQKKRGIKVGIYGDYSTGKTHFALTAPEPIYIIDTELGAPPLSHMFKDKDIKILDVAEKDGSKSYEKMIAAIDFIAKEKAVGTVIVDSMSDFWEFAQEYGKVNVFKIKPQDRLAQQWDWGILNKLYQAPLLKLIKLNCNLILTARAQEMYARAGEPMGVYKPKWQKNTGFWVDFVLYNTKKIDKIGHTTFTSYVDKSRPVRNLMGRTFHNLTFSVFMNEIEKVKGGEK